MAIEFVPVTPAEQEELARFLTSAFRMQPDAPFVNPTLLRWKYFENRPDWAGPRSYVLKQSGHTIAHGCICPLTLTGLKAEITSMRVIDWAGSPRVPGSGVLLMKKLAAFTDTVLAPGGSAQTQAVVPKIGFNRIGYLDTYARVIRPWVQFRTYPPNQGWKAPIRLIRNAAWSFSAFSATPRDWSAARISTFDPSMASVVDGLRAGMFTPAKRSIEMLNYMLRCPGALFTAFLLFRAEQMCGYFVLSRLGGQSRITDVRVNSGNAADWRDAYGMAVRSAAEDPHTCEVMAVASCPAIADALRRNGFRLRRREPIFFLDPKNLLIREAPLNIQLLDGDECYLYDPAYPYLT